MKPRILKVIALILAVCYVAAMVLGFVFGLSFVNYWFSLILVLIGFHEILKCSLYKVDSFLYSGTLLFFVGAVGVFRHYFGIYGIFVLPWYLLAVSLASFCVFVFFRQLIHLKICLSILAVVVILFLFCYNVINLNTFLIVIAIYVSAVLLNLAIRLVINTRRE